ncbi:MAG: hypothetical protein IJM68_08435 [Synergistaceae bacterium]|nr:hypothetical protein [Synergistaceae bacterium]MBR0184575.1 hypothetical protein [Synergistaceae bacterium]
MTRREYADRISCILVEGHRETNSKGTNTVAVFMTASYCIKTHIIALSYQRVFRADEVLSAYVFRERYNSDGLTDSGAADAPKMYTPTVMNDIRGISVRISGE